jgi:choline kinase
MNVVFLMAGLGTRMGHEVPKPLQEVNGIPMIQAAVNSFNIAGNYIFVARKYEENKYNIRLKEVIESLGLASYEIIELDYLTDGPAASALCATRFINNGEELIITNCDQVLKWESSHFTEFLRNTDKDGIVITYPAHTDKNSYIKLDEQGNGVEVAEKKIISQHSLNGVHWWKQGADFVSSAKSMISKNIRVNNEFYIAPTYNELINTGKKIGIYALGEGEHFPVGTKEDLDKFLRIENGTL